MTELLIDYPSDPHIKPRVCITDGEHLWFAAWPWIKRHIDDCEHMRVLSVNSQCL